MIYDDQTLEKCSFEVLKKHEVKLTKELETDTHYWLSSYNDNDRWQFKVEISIKCLAQVRKHIIKRK